MRRFASDRVGGIMQKLGMEHGEAIEHRWVTKAIENASERSRPTTSTSESSFWSTTTSQTTSAERSTRCATS